MIGPVDVAGHLAAGERGVLGGDCERPTGARTLERARRFLLAGTRSHTRAEIDVRSTELDSILRLIRSRLDVSLRGLRRRSHR